MTFTLQVILSMTHLILYSCEVGETLSPQCHSQLSSLPTLVCHHPSSVHHLFFFFLTFFKSQFPGCCICHSMHCSREKMKVLWSQHFAKISSRFPIACQVRHIVFISIFYAKLHIVWVSLMAQMVKNLPAMRETLVRSLGWEDPLEKGMATQSRILAWRIPWTEEPGGLQSMESQRIRHDWATNTEPLCLGTGLSNTGCGTAAL